MLPTFLTLPSSGSRAGIIHEYNQANNQDSLLIIYLVSVIAMVRISIVVLA